MNKVGSDLTHKHQTKQKSSARDNHSSLLRTFVNYWCRKVYNIGPHCGLPLKGLLVTAKTGIYTKVNLINFLKYYTIMNLDLIIEIASK